MLGICANLLSCDDDNNDIRDVDVGVGATKAAEEGEELTTLLIRVLPPIIGLLFLLNNDTFCLQSLVILLLLLEEADII